VARNPRSIVLRVLLIVIRIILRLVPGRLLGGRLGRSMSIWAGCVSSCWGRIHAVESLGVLWRGIVRSRCDHWLVHERSVVEAASRRVGRPVLAPGAPYGPSVDHSPVERDDGQSGVFVRVQPECVMSKSRAYYTRHLLDKSESAVHLQPHLNDESKLLE
jgi:hypothetical protein